MKKLTKFIIFFFTLMPFLAFAQNASDATSVLAKISNFLSALLPFLISLGVIYFIWGVVQYFIGNSDEAKTKGKDKIIYGIIGLAVIISIWGLVYILTETLGLGKGGQGAPVEVSNLVTQVKNSGCPIINATAKLSNVLDSFTCIIGNSVIPFIFALAIVMFIWGAVNFLLMHGEDEAKRTQGKQFMIWGIIALAVMISIWGLVNIFGNTFGISGGVLPQVQPYTNKP